MDVQKYIFSLGMVGKWNDLDEENGVVRLNM